MEMRSRGKEHCGANTAKTRFAGKCAVICKILRGLGDENAFFYGKRIAASTVPRGDFSGNASSQGNARLSERICVVVAMKTRLRG